MKKIGIITHYYQSKNFGGALQSYALCKVLEKYDYEAEQICVPIEGESIDTPHTLWEKIQNKGFIGCIKFVIKQVFLMPFQIRIRAREEKKHDVINRRQKAFAPFIEGYTPHSKTVYNKQNISECIEDYDAFITGSDQVWNLDWYNPIYLLEFVPQNKIKISYAASLATDFLSDRYQQIFKNALESYQAISVREKSSVQLLEKLAPTKVEWVLDPTLLLSGEDWNQVCDEYSINEKYLFCYFLGNNKKARALARKTAKEKKLKLVTIAYASGKIQLVDKNWGDERLFDVSPQQFISLIKNAEYIFTDSFHAVVFSFIYQKQYFVFNRNRQGEMSARITDITNLFNTEERFCVGKTRENLEYINNLPNIDYSIKNEKFMHMQNASINFLLNNLKR